MIDSQLICRDIFVTLAACLAATSRISLATGVTNPLTRHVSATASAIATLEEMHPGRVLAGVGTGFSSLRTIGMPAAKATELERFVVDLKALLRKDGVAFQNGVRGGMPWLQRPCPAQVVVAASGPKMTRLAARIADGAILLQGVAPDLLDRGIGWLADGAKDAVVLSMNSASRVGRRWGSGPPRPPAAMTFARASRQPSCRQSGWFEEEPDESGS